jgi:hypothetical protein
MELERGKRIERLGEKILRRNAVGEQSLKQVSFSKARSSGSLL